MSDSTDQEKTTSLRRPSIAPATPNTEAEPGNQTEPVAPHGQTVMVKASPRAREAAAALSAEREAKRSQEQSSPSSGHTPSIDSVDFDVTAGLGDEALAESEGFFDVTEGAAEAAPIPSTPPASPPESPSVPPATAEPATAGATGRRVLMAIVAAAVIAVVLWFLTR